MIVDISKNILIVGLGLLGGSYARVLKRFGFHISAITKEQSSIDYALQEGIIDEGSTELDKKMIGKADLVIFALYPHIFVEWIEQNQSPNYTKNIEYGMRHSSTLGLGITHRSCNICRYGCTNVFA